jgi:hypothetical protein
METALASPRSQESDPATALLELSSPEDRFRRMKACSVVTYSEATLLRLPWSGLDRKKNERGGMRLKLEVEEESRGIQWNVSSRGGRMVGSRERAIFRALEWIAIEGSLSRGVPFTNPLVVHPRDICERLCWRTTQAQFEAIEEAIEHLCRIEIECVRLGRSPRSTRFGLLRSLSKGSQSSAERSTSFPHFAISFGGFFTDSVNAGRVRPLNWDLWTALRDPLARRMLEVIESEFETPDAGSAALDSDRLARLLPLDLSLRGSRRQILLDEAHSALLRRGYLEKVERRSRGSSELFLYRPGPTYLAMRYRLGKLPALHSCKRILRDLRDAGEDRSNHTQRMAQT